jgi:hypothetical protein
MSVPPHRPVLFLLLGALALCRGGAAAAAEPANSREPVDDQDAITIRGIFDFQLPKIIDPKAIRFTVSPSFGDFLNSDVVRVRCGARYAFSQRFEASVEAVPFFDNFGGSGPGGIGCAEYRVGGKYNWGAVRGFDTDATLGFTVTLPGPGAPPDLTVGTAVFSPYVVFSRDLPRVQGLSSFLNLGCEIFDSDPAPGRIPAYRPSRDNISITPGVVLHRAPWHYTMALSLRSSVLGGENRQYFSVLPSVSWEVPGHYTRWVGGRWIAGLGYEAVFYDHGTENRFTGRLKWYFDWRKAVREMGQKVRANLPWPGGNGHGANGAGAGR